MATQPKVNKWSQKVKAKPGAFHKQLGYPVTKPIPEAILQRAAHTAKMGTQIHGHTLTPLMRRRANFILNRRKH